MKLQRGLALGCLLAWFAVTTVASHGAQDWTGLTGQVVCAGTPIRRAFVYVRDPGGKSDTVVSLDANGQFAVPLSPGLYDIFVSELTFVPICQRVEILRGKSFRFVAELQVDNQHLEDNVPAPR